MRGKTTYLSIDTRSPIPVYVQIMDQIRDQVRGEALPPATPLPAVRQLADDLGLNPNTVARAYGDLESAGVIAKRRGSGCVVASTRSSKDSKVLSDVLKSQIDELISTAGAAGIGLAELIQMIKSNSGSPSQTPGSGPMKQKPTKNRKPATTRETPQAIWQPDDEFID